MINRLQYLRVSLLKSCNLNCFYCNPSSENKEKQKVANFDKLKSAIKLLHSLGLEKIRFTGGEPTLYNKLPELITFVKELDSSIHIGLTTNALLMNQKARLLADCGLDSVNISIDTLQKDKFYQVTGKDRWNDVIRGIKESIKHLSHVKLNTVMIRNFNDSESNDLIQFANNLKVDIRFIEYMPTKHNSQNRDEYISGTELMNSLPYKFVLEKAENNSAAKYYRATNLDIKVGFINPISHSFCSQCNRIRLASDGHLYGCLFSSASFNLFNELQNGYESASTRIHELIQNKTFTGCAGLDSYNSDLPSFINIGG